MELAALALLGGAGYLLAQNAGPKSVYPTKLTPHSSVRQAIERREAFSNPSPSPSPSTSLRGPAADLDLMYMNAGTSTAAPPAEPSPGIPSTYAPRGPAVPKQRPGATATPDVMMNPAGVEENPNYMDGDVMMSGLSGQQMKSSDFVHNNMQPFFGSRVRQNVGESTNVSRLDMYTGSGSTQVRKKEVEQMFDTTQQPFGNVYGLENSSDFVQSRINDPRSRNSERPFEPVQVAPGVGEGFSSTGKGGFQQFEVNEIMMGKMKRTDDLRTANNPKLTYSMPVVPGQQFIGKSMEDVGEVRKYRPDAFYIDENGERFGAAGQGEFTKETSRPIQIMPHTNRPDTSVEYAGPGASQDFGMNYVVGSYRTPSGYQYGGAGYRNADAIATGGGSSAADDYGKESYEIRPNERYFTSDRTMGLNVSPAEAGAVTTHFEDDSRPTRRSETVGNINQAGNATGYANAAPSITVWDPNDIARTTIREGTIDLDRFGIAGPADGPARLTVYDPDDIARPTQKAQISAKSSYVGGPKAAHERFMNHTFAYNMRLNPSKEQIAKGRKAMGGNIQVFQGDEPNVTSRKLDTDVINGRDTAVNRSLDLGPGVADIGRVKYRAPLKLDIAADRNQREIIAAAEDNPLMQSLRKNAELDSAAYGEAY